MSKGTQSSSGSPGHIRKRTSASGTVSWQAIASYRAGGRRRVLSGTRATQKEAKALLVELLEQAQTLNDSAISEVQTVEQLLSRFERTRGKDWSASTRRQWESVCKRHYGPKWGKRKLRSIKLYEVEDWIEDLASGKGTAIDPLAPSTVKRILNPIASAFSYAVANGLIARNPFKGCKISKGEAQGDGIEVEEGFRDPADAIRVLAALEQDTAIFVACQLAADTGLRRGEVCALRFCDLDLAGGTLMIRRSAVLGPGDTVVVQPKTKTKSNRAIILANHTLDLLADQRRRVMDEAARFGVIWSEDLFIFPSPGDPRFPLRPDLLSKKWHEATERAGVSMRFHDLRHLQATVLLTSGHDLVTVAGRLGHSGGGRMTLATYAHRVREIEAIAAEEMARKMRPETDDCDGVEAE